MTTHSLCQLSTCLQPEQPLPLINRLRAMRVSIILVVASISILAGLCLSQIFTSYHPNSLQSIPSPATTKRQPSTAFYEQAHSLAAATVAAPAAPLNPLVTLQDEIKALEAKDGTLEHAISRASQAVEVTQEKVKNTVARPSSVSAKVSASGYSPAQITADLEKVKESSKTASSAVNDAKKHLQNLEKEEFDLRTEIHELLAKLERVQIVTGAHIYVADGMGGSVFEAAVTRPIGGKSSVKIIKGVNAAVEAVEKKVASADAARDAHVAPSFPQKDKGGDGMGGANFASPVTEPQNSLPAVVPPKGMTTVISSDDGMGERIVPAAKEPLNVESPSVAPGSLSAAQTDGGLGEKVVKASGSSVPSNAEPKPFILSHGKNVDGIGGTGRHLNPRISNAEAAFSYHGDKSGDGMGGKVPGTKDSGSVSRVPLTGPMIAADPASDGMGGKKGARK
jgi:hypothetical protein